LLIYLHYQIWTPEAKRNSELPLSILINASQRNVNKNARRHAQSTRQGKSVLKYSLLQLSALFLKLYVLGAVYASKGVLLRLLRSSTYPKDLRMK
jgi:hypothetical protein